jgi:ribosomal protein L37AE/L43A
LRETEHAVPCYRCGARQTDPARGASPWRRGVRDSEQVLVCPDCQRTSDWTAHLDRCPACGSTALVRRLSRTVCRDCGGSPDGGLDADLPEAGAEVAGPAGPPTDLAAEVAAAIDRVLDRVPAAASSAMRSAGGRPGMTEVP